MNAVKTAEQFGHDCNPEACSTTAMSMHDMPRACKGSQRRREEASSRNAWPVTAKLWCGERVPANATTMWFHWEFTKTCGTQIKRAFFLPGQACVCGWPHLLHVGFDVMLHHLTLGVEKVWIRNKENITVCACVCVCVCMCVCAGDIEYEKTAPSCDIVTSIRQSS